MTHKIFTIEDLKKHTSVATKIYVSVKGTVYDVTSSKDFYGPGQDYSFFAGKDATRCLAKMQLNDAEANCGWTNLNEEHRDVLNSWEATFIKKYPVVGRLDPDPNFEARGLELEP